MKDFQYIILKLLKKHTIPLLLVAMVLFFIVNISNTPIALAQEQIASVSCCVNVCTDDEIEKVCSNNYIVSNGKESWVDFNEIDVTLKVNSRLEIEYLVKNIGTGSNFLTFKLNEKNLKNFKVELFVNHEFAGDFKEYQHLLKQQEKLNIKIVLSIYNVAQNACLSGNLSLVVNSFGGNDA